MCDQQPKGTIFMCDQLPTRNKLMSKVMQQRKNEQVVEQHHNNH
jgi:hypothetical protein